MIKARMLTPSERFASIVDDLKTAGVSATEIASAIGISKSAISKAKSGGTKSLTAENLIALEDRYGFSLRWIVTGEGPRTVPRYSGRSITPQLLMEKLADGSMLDISDLDASARAAITAMLKALRAKP